MKKIIVGLALGLCSLCTIPACHIPDLSKVRLADCMRDCSDSVDAQCKDASSGTDPCFDDVQACFDASSQCSDDCALVPDPDQDACDRECVHQARDCSHQIKPCIQHEQQQVSADLVDGCVDPLVSCISSCVDDVEAALKGHS